LGRSELAVSLVGLETLSLIGRELRPVWSGGPTGHEDQVRASQGVEAGDQEAMDIITGRLSAGTIWA